MHVTAALRFYAVISAFIAWITVVDGSCYHPDMPFKNGFIIYESRQDSQLEEFPDYYVLQFRCLKKYFLLGPRSIMCRNGRWTSIVPKCIKAQCPDPPAIINGQFQLKTRDKTLILPGSKAMYSCDEGYRLSNKTASSLLCYFDDLLNSMYWRGNEPSCTKKTPCPDPGVSFDGMREGNCCYEEDILKYSCQEGYELSGQSDIECLPSGKWTFKRPLCKPLDTHCKHPPFIPHSVLKASKAGDYYMPYDTVQVVCEPGYTYQGPDEVLMCEENGTWDEEFAECTETYCNLPVPLGNGSIPELEFINATSVPYNFKITYVCDRGFRLIGDSWRFCEPNGWSGEDPYCEAIKCTDPGDPENGRRLSNGLEIGDKMVFICDSGYTLIGSFERYCLPNGQWDGELARCDSSNNYCPNPGIPINGAKNSTTYDLGDTVGFSCRPGYTLIGSEVRKCLPNGAWSGTEAKCLGPNDFDNSVAVKNALKLMIEEKAREQEQKIKDFREIMASFNASENIALMRTIPLDYSGRLVFYFVFDVSGSVGKDNFKKSVEFAKALIKEVGIKPQGARAGAITFSSKREIHFHPAHFSTTADVIHALDNLNYTGGGTATTDALQAVKDEMLPLARERLGPKPQKSIVFILTDGKANMAGDPQVVANELKKAGVEIYCIGITGQDLKNSLYEIATDSNHVYILQNYAVMSWLIQEITNGTIDYSECGLGHKMAISQARIIGGKTVRNIWPWMAALYFLKSNKSKEAELQCGGSIIDQDYILTAAHCMYKEKKIENKKHYELRKKEEIHVKLGLTNVKDQSHIQEFEVENFYMHPNFHIGPMLDNDIALLKLVRPIQFNPFVRPVCLPPMEMPRDTVLYQPDEWAVVTGWGHNEIVQINEEVDWKFVDDLKEIVLPIQSQNTCDQNLKDKGWMQDVFTERMFCAGDGRGGEDTCLGDSGGPLMQSRLNQEGNTYWTQVGIVSWGIGCGLNNTYGFYTHVQKFLPWIERTIHDTSGN